MSNENCNLYLPEINQNEVVEDYLDLIRCSQPYCNCGKCIINKYSQNSPNYLYNKGLKSTYKDEYYWKKREDKKSDPPKGKSIIQNLGLDNCFKEHLKSSFVSVMRNDYGKNLKLKEDYIYKNINDKFTDRNNKNKDNNFPRIISNIEDIDFKNNSKKDMYVKVNRNNNRSSTNSNNIIYHRRNINENNNNNNNDKTQILDKTLEHKVNDLNNNMSINDENTLKHIIEVNKLINPPFIGRSSYELMYPDWGCSKVEKEKLDRKLLDNIPFNGKSNYQEYYHEHDKRYYVDRASPIYKNDNLESSGKSIHETTAKNSYKPINYEMSKELNKKVINISKRPSSIVPAPYSKDSFLSSYEKAFMYNNFKRPLPMRNINNSVIY